MREKPDVMVRRATASDIAILRRFEQGIIAAERPFDPTIRKGDVHYYDLAALVAASDAFVAIAEIGGAPVGCGFARKTASRSFAEPPFHACVGMMFVAPDHRRRGVSSLVIARLKAWAKDVGLTALHLEVYPGNEAAVRTYEKAGFGPYMLEMRLPLDGD